MDGNYDDLEPITPGPSESVNEHHSLAHAHKAITSRDIDALLQLKLLRRALRESR